MRLDPVELRAQFWALRDVADAIRSKVAPLRAAYDAASAEADTRLSKMRAEIRAAEVGLADVDYQRGMIARALAGKTGEGPEALPGAEAESA